MTAPDETTKCALCDERPPRQDLVRGKKEWVCRACIEHGLSQTLADRRAAVDGETIPGGRMLCSYCRTKTPTNALYQPGGEEATKAICTICLGASYSLLTQQIELSARRHYAFVEKQDPTAAAVLEEHFGGRSPGEIVTSSREFPGYLRPDLHDAIQKLVSDQDARCLGLHRRYQHEMMTYASLTESGRNGVRIAPLQHEAVDVGHEEPARCVRNALFLVSDGETPHAIVLAPAHRRGGGMGWHVEIAVPAGEPGMNLVQRYFREMEESIRRSASYRGKALSLECDVNYGGETSGAIIVHRLAPVAREDIILPDRTLALLERNVFQFFDYGARLRSLGMPLKKGLLFYGPPGTGKTHTVRYLAGALPDHTTLLVTAQEVAAIGEYMALARLLSPAVVVIEDVDLIARDRVSLDTPVQESLLNRLLNEMDGLRDNAEVLFILTTNRPETLEAALAGRPGRIDQAVEFPLPDESGRRRLIDLYRRDLRLPDDVMIDAVRRTEGVTASFIKELMRRTAQAAIDRQADADEATRQDVDAALGEMLFDGGSLNAKLLGASVESSRPQ